MFCNDRVGHTMTRQWYYRVSGEDRGPVSSSELMARARSREVTPATLVRREGEVRWLVAETVSGLFATDTATSNTRAEVGVQLARSRRTSRKSGIKKTAIQLCDDIEDAMCIVRGLVEYYDLNRTQIATICEIIRPIAEQLRELEKDLP